MGINKKRIKLYKNSMNNVKKKPQVPQPMAFKHYKQTKLRVRFCTFTSFGFFHF